MPAGGSTAKVCQLKLIKHLIRVNEHYLETANKRSKPSRKDLEDIVAALKEQNAQLEQKNKNTVTQLREVQQQVTLLQQTGASSSQRDNSRNTGNSEVSNLIDKPGGKFNLEETLGIEHPEYLSLRRDVRTLMIQAQIDWTENFHRVDSQKMSMVCKGAIAKHPHLKKYKNTWPVAVIANTHMQGKRKHRSRTIKKYQAAHNQNTDSEGQGE
ncbi:hypothetical protein NLI96_g2090 [Meripilus lineatus]|uniref:Uncharacterized protein n=1 Tax=Meripilus lineatus TaxID=2056292 RepID=A0AAD5YMC1_9APHY|nr:hypothetical protein NLI96_g2090 [Physisporinus lineatus]